MEANIALTDVITERISFAQVSRLQVTNQTREHSEGPEFSLPHADGGKDAWLFLAACFVVEALVWGMSFL